MYRIINNLEVSNTLDKDKELEIGIAGGSRAAFLSREEALALMEHIAKVFQLDSSDFDLEGELND